MPASQVAAEVAGEMEDTGTSMSEAEPEPAARVRTNQRWVGRQQLAAMGQSGRMGWVGRVRF